MVGVRKPLSAAAAACCCLLVHAIVNFTSGRAGDVQSKSYLIEAGRSGEERRPNGRYYFGQQYVVTWEVDLECFRACFPLPVEIHWGAKSCVHASWSSGLMGGQTGEEENLACTWAKAHQ